MKNLFLLFLMTSFLVFTACQNSSTESATSATTNTAEKIESPTMGSPEIVKKEQPVLVAQKEEISQTEEPAAVPKETTKLNTKPTEKPIPKAEALPEPKASTPAVKKETVEVTPVEEEEKTTVPSTTPPAEVQQQERPRPPKVIPPAIHAHAKWDKLLSQYVSSTGKVNYSGFKSVEGQLDAYLQELADNPVQSNWSRAQKIAYWINAYNAFTVKLILDNYPTSSIMKLHGGKPWDVKWIKIGGTTYSLNNIEHDILRPKYKDARIHFAVNCAARSCPPLLNRAWTDVNLENNFERQAKKFITNSRFNKISAQSVEISKIFEWYAVDFGDIVSYLNKYSDTTIASGANVTYLDYDWALNN